MEKDLVMRKAPSITDKKVQWFFEKCKRDPELSIFLRNNYYSVYLKGLVFAIIHPRSIEMPGDLKNSINPSKPVVDYYEEHFDKLKEIVKKGMPADIERRNQQVISSINSSTGMAICDFEYAISEEYLRDKGKPEIDIVAVDNNHCPTIYIIEYKCTATALKEPRGVIGHYLDFVKIKNSIRFPDLVNSILVSYNTLVNEGIIKNRNIGPVNIDNVIKNVHFAFLFTDLRKEEYIPYLEKVKKLNQELPIMVAHFDTYEDVKLRSADFVPIIEFV